MSGNPLLNHAIIDWDDWQPAAPGDARSPCPMLNALANHNILPHDGKGISQNMAVEVLTKALNLGSFTAWLFASQAVRMNPDPKAHTFDLDHVRKHGAIEHDVSLSRSDYGLGNNHDFDEEIWRRVLDTYGDYEETTFPLASKARYQRLIACKKALEADGKEFNYGFKELILSYGETALLMGILGDEKNGKMPVKYMKVLIEEERVPVEEGWTKRPHPFTQFGVLYLVFNLFWANENKWDEVYQAVVGTVRWSIGTARDWLMSPRNLA